MHNLIKIQNCLKKIIESLQKGFAITECKSRKIHSDEKDFLIKLKYI